MGGAGRGHCLTWVEKAKEGYHLPPKSGHPALGVGYQGGGSPHPPLRKRKELATLGEGREFTFFSHRGQILNPLQPSSESGSSVTSPGQTRVVPIDTSLWDSLAPFFLSPLWFVFVLFCFFFAVATAFPEFTSPNIKCYVLGKQICNK